MSSRRGGYGDGNNGSSGSSVGMEVTPPLFDDLHYLNIGMPFKNIKQSVKQGSDESIQSLLNLRKSIKSDPNVSALSVTVKPSVIPPSAPTTLSSMKDVHQQWLVDMLAQFTKQAWDNKYLVDVAVQITDVIKNDDNDEGGFENKKRSRVTEASYSSYHPSIPPPLPPSLLPVSKSLRSQILLYIDRLVTAVLKWDVTSRPDILSLQNLQRELIDAILSEQRVLDMAVNALQAPQIKKVQWLTSLKSKLHAERGNAAFLLFLS